LEELEGIVEITTMKRNGGELKIEFGNDMGEVC